MLRPGGGYTIPGSLGLRDGYIETSRSLSRVVQFEWTEAAAVANAYTETVLPLPYMSQPEGAGADEGCVNYLPGYTDRFIASPPRARKPLLFFGLIEFAENATGDRIAYINFHDRATDAFSSSWNVAARACAAWDTFLSWSFISYIPEEVYATLSVLHNGSTTLDVWAMMGFASI